MDFTLIRYEVVIGTMSLRSLAASDAVELQIQQRRVGWPATLIVSAVGDDHNKYRWQVDGVFVEMVSEVDHNIRHPVPDNILLAVLRAYRTVAMSRN